MPSQDRYPVIHRDGTVSYWSFTLASQRTFDAAAEVHFELVPACCRDFTFTPFDPLREFEAEARTSDSSIELTFDMRGTGPVEVELTANGAPYRGVCAVEVMDAARALRRVHFLSAPTSSAAWTPGPTWSPPWVR